MIDNWQERELHCKWYGHALSRVLRREPIYLAMSAPIGKPDDKPRGVPHVEIRQCECCRRELREPKNNLSPMVNPAIQDKRRYWQSRPGPDWSWATSETQADAIEYAGGDDPTVQYEIREVWMTPKEFEAMPEHGGW